MKQFKTYKFFMQVFLIVHFFHLQNIKFHFNHQYKILKPWCSSFAIEFWLCNRCNTFEFNLKLIWKFNVVEKWSKLYFNWLLELRKNKISSIKMCNSIAIFFGILHVLLLLTTQVSSHEKVLNKFILQINSWNY